MRNKRNKHKKTIKVVSMKSKHAGYNYDYMFIGKHTKVEYITSKYVRLLGRIHDIDIVDNKLVITYLICREHIKYIITRIIRR